MKKTILVLGVLLLFSISASAISLSGKGFKVGPNFSKLTGDDFIISNNTDTYTYSWKFDMGYTAGFFVTFNITDKFLFQPELLYSYKKVKVEDIDSKLKMKYIEIPLLFKYAIQNEGKIRPNLFLGPYYGLKNKVRVVIDSASYAFLLNDAVKGEYEDDIKNIRRSDFGFIFGAGMDYVTNYGTFTLDIRYSMGFTSIAKEIENGWNFVDENNESLDLKNNNMYFLLGYSF